MHADRYRHVHIGSPVAKRRPGGDIENPSRIDDRRQRKRRRYQVKGLACARVGSRPHGYGQEHDVHRREPGNRERPDQPRILGIVRDRIRSRIDAPRSRQRAERRSDRAAVFGSRHLTVARFIDRFTRANSTPGRANRVLSTDAMQAAQWTPGTERSVWRAPLPRSRLASRISSAASTRIDPGDRQGSLGTGRTAAHDSGLSLAQRSRRHLIAL